MSDVLWTKTPKPDVEQLMIEPTRDDICHRVILSNHREPQYGVLTAIDQSPFQFVFVRYDGDTIDTMTWTGVLVWE